MGEGGMGGGGRFSGCGSGFVLRKVHQHADTDL